MNGKEVTRDSFTERLEEYIETEMQAPEEEIDMEFIYECEQMLNVLNGQPPMKSKKEAKEYVKKIKEKTSQTKKKSLSIMKKVLVASIAVLIICIGSVTVYAGSPIKGYLADIMKMNIGKSFETDGNTFIHLGPSVTYKNIEELIEKEGLDIKIPQYIPYNAKLKEIHKTKEEVNTLYFTYNDNRINHIIEINSDLDSNIKKQAEEISINGYNCFIITKRVFSIAYVIIDNNLYQFECDSKEELIKIIESME